MWLLLDLTLKFWKQGDKRVFPLRDGFFCSSEPIGSLPASSYPCLGWVGIGATAHFHRQRLDIRDWSEYNTHWQGSCQFCH